MRKFRVYLQDIETDEVVVEYPVPTHFQHNGFGGGTETQPVQADETGAVLNLLKELKQKMQYGWNKTIQSESSPNGESSQPLYPFSAMCDVGSCDYTSAAKTLKLAESNVKLHKKYKHSGAKVGTKA